MAREPMELPTGVEFVGKSIRIRFSLNRKRHCETLPLPQTPKGIAAAEALRSQVTQLAKQGVLAPEKFRELFPNSRSDSTGQMPIFFDYAQDWLNSLQIEDSTRKNYRSTMQNYWVPHLAEYPLDKITPVLMRKIVNGITWTSPIRRKGAIRLVTSLLTQAVNDELILRNPTNSFPPTRVVKREIDPTSGLQSIYTCFFEFSFYTGMRPGEAMALRWSEVDTRSRRAKVCRIRLYGKIKERTKTKVSREVLLNDRAL